MPNFALDAARGYQAVNDIFRQDRLDKQADEDRKIALEDREYNKKRQEKFDVRQDTMWQRDDQAHADQQTLRDLNVAEVEMIFGKDVAQNPQAVSKISGLAKDPQRVGEMIAVHEELTGYLSAGKTPPQDLLVKMLNMTGAEELQARGGDDGLTRQVESIVPSNTPGEVMIGLNVTGKDGKTYQAPMTTGASADPADNIVQSFPVSKLIEHVGGATATAKTLAMARAKAGDTSFLDAYRASIAARQERAEGLKDYELKKQIDQKYEKPQGPVAAGRYGMFHNGKFYQNPATQGLEEGGWESVTDPETGEETMRRTGKRGTGEKQTVKANDDGSFSVYDPVNGQAHLAYPPTIADRMADDMYKAWEEQNSGTLGFGGASEEEKKAKRKEFRDSIPTVIPTGQPGGQSGTGGQPAGQGQLTPGQVIEQNGVEYVVDAQGVPQEKNGGQAQAEKGAPGKKAGTAQAAEKPDSSKKKGDQAPARMLELDQQKAGRKGPVVSDDLKAVKDVVKAVPGAVADTAKVGLDIYQSLVGQPFLDALSQLKTAQQKQRATFNTEQRYKNGTISADEYKKAIAILNSK